MKVDLSQDPDRADVLGPLIAQAERLAEDEQRLGSQQPPPVDPSAAGVQHGGQVRMAYRLAAAYPRRLMHVHGIGWHAWDGRRWVEDETGEAKRAVLDVFRQALYDSLDDKQLRNDVKRCESAAGVNGVLDIAAALEEFAYTVKELDADPYQLNVDNGTLDLHTMTLRPHSPDDRITKVAAGAYDPGATSEIWAGFLERVLPDVAVRDFLCRYVGLSLAGRVLEHVLAILTGTGRNGKGAFYGAVNHALGDYAGVADPYLFMHRDGAHPTGEMDLRGRRWVVVSESEKDRRLAEATVKRLTGGDEIKARRMRQDFVSFPPSHTAALVTNHLPKVAGDDPALWARLRVVPFDVVIPDDEQDEHLAEKLAAEATAVLSWALAGWQQYLEHGLAQPDAVRRATDAYHDASDAIARFITDCCLTGDHYQVPFADLWSEWQAWRADDGAEEIRKKDFGLALERRGYPDHRGAQGRHYRRRIALAAPEDDL